MTKKTSAVMAENDALRIREACNSASDFRRLRIAREKGWRDSEILEYARICFHRSGKDYATPGAIRRALEYAVSRFGFALKWRKGFRKSGSIIAPPRSGAIVDTKVGPDGLTPFYRFWPYHSGHVIAKVNAMVRERLHLSPTDPVPVNEWNRCHYEYFDDQRHRMWDVQKQRRKAARAKKAAEKAEQKQKRKDERARKAAEKAEQEQKRENARTQNTALEAVAA